jgi:cyclase
MFKARLAIIAALALSASASAQQDFSKVEVKVEKLAPGVAVLFGAGGNIGVSYGADGTVLIDDQFAPLTPKIQAAVSALGASPVKFLINTHWHFDHSGGNENFGRAGAIIMAHDNVRVRMAKGGSVAGNTAPPASPVALPIVTYAEGLKLHLNGDEVRTIHTGGGHTDGDSIVVWRSANVVHMGDMFMNKVSLPFIDISSGGNVVHLLASLNKAIALTNAQTKIIPGHGPMATQADLIAWRDMIASIVQSVDKSMKAKKTLAQIKALKPAAKGEVAGGFISGDAFVEAVYKSLENKASSKHRH